MPGRALRILIVEDQFLVAKQLEWIIAQAGHSVVGVAASSDEACDLAASTNPDIAFIDLNLADGSTGLDVANFIAARCETRVVFTTANRRRLPSDYCGAVGVIDKPFTHSGILSALRYVEAVIGDVSVVPPKPASLQLPPETRPL